MPQQPRKQRLSPFTLMVIAAGGAVLLSFAVPGFMGEWETLRYSGVAASFQESVAFAREHADAHRVETVLCSSTDGESCSGTADWSHGWIAVTPGGVVLRRWPRRHEDLSLKGSVDALSFEPDGRLLAEPSPRLTLQSKRCRSRGAKILAVEPAGGVAVSRGRCR